MSTSERLPIDGGRSVQPTPFPHGCQDPKGGVQAVLESLRSGWLPTEPYVVESERAMAWATAAFERLLRLPLFPRMSDADADEVVAALRKVIGYYARCTRLSAHSS